MALPRALPKPLHQPCDVASGALEVDQPDVLVWAVGAIRVVADARFHDGHALTREQVERRRPAAERDEQGRKSVNVLRGLSGQAHQGRVGIGDPRTVAGQLFNLNVAKSFDVPQLPGEILIRPDAAVAYITCMPAGKIAVVDLRTWQLQPTIDLTPGVDGMAWSAAN